MNDTGRKKVLGVLDGHRESEASWTELAEQLRTQGFQLAPKLAIGDGGLGFWKAVAKCWPQADQQRCWIHKTANVLNKVHKSAQPPDKGSAARSLDGRNERWRLSRIFNLPETL